VIDEFDETAKLKPLLGLDLGAHSLVEGAKWKRGTH
jgi:hypothetical protein